MSKSRTQKDQEVTTLVDRLQHMKSVVFSSYDGLKVTEATALRKKLRDEGIAYHVVKRTLLERALKQTGLAGLPLDGLRGGLALAFGFEDEVLPAKLLGAFQKEHAGVVLQGAIVQGRWYGAAQAQTLAKLPSRLELFAQVIRSLRSPMAGWCIVASGPARGLITVLKARSEQPAT